LSFTPAIRPAPPASTRCPRDSYERFIASGEYDFRRRGDAERLRDVVKLSWEMVSTEDDSVAGVGLEFLVIDAEGRIRSDYQFIES
jgi:hypothetical protein